MLTERSARVVAAVKLHRHAARKREQRFLAEGPNLIEAAISRGLVLEVFATEAAADRHHDLLTSAQVPVRAVTERAAKALSDTVTPTGMVAVCDLPQPQLAEVLPGSGLVAVAVGVSEPGNAGTLIRLGHAMGAGAVVLAGHSVDPYNGKCLRASTGSIFAVPVVVEPDTDAVIAALRAAGLRILATALDGAVDLADADLTAPTAWLFGPEAHGLAPEIAAAADQRVRIEMPGDAESLNVAAAAAICLYQSSRVLAGSARP
ncbi:RNA methyltransferase [[Mycobacterium] kokjensenii]|uniref:RNA methyltransferase n=1 Tax=[Mycobacterium] kokjensenii TaxID=3064287 RepID=A0ABM9LE71_9MYCO|nr:RNA methyltransferase [Mycolicibacter sp. MU0083]CAJ1497541.1 RNA methyltransferase [Mycolicibacter sp. MU0083]